jgi:hypothetical protein
MSVIERYNFFLDSKYRNSGTNPAPSFNLKTPITLNNPMHYFKCRVVSCEIPYSFKSLSVPFNTLRIIYDYNSGMINTTTTITITEGNYSIIALLDELKTRLIEYITIVNPSHVPDFDFTYNKDTGKVTLIPIRLNGSNTTITLFWSDPNVDFLAEFFGFDGTIDSVLSYSNGGANTSINNISQINVNCSPITAIYIRSSSLTQKANNEEYLVEFTESVSDIIYKVLINVPYGSWIMSNNNDLEIIINNKVIDQLSFYLTTLSYNVINLQGVHWRMHLEITEIRPAYLDIIEEKNREDDSKIQEIEQMRSELLNQLSDVNDDIKQKLTRTEPEQKVDIEQMKQEFINDVEQNRQAEIN